MLKRQTDPYCRAMGHTGPKSNRTSHVYDGGDSWANTELTKVNYRYRDLGRAWGGVYRTNDISMVLNVRRGLEGQVMKDAATVLIERGHLLLVDYTAWSWLERTLHDAFSSYVGGDRSHWLYPLFQRVGSYMAVRVNPLTLKASDYFPGAGESTTQLPPLKTLDKAEETFDNLRAIIEPVMLSWLDYPAKPVDKARGWLLRVLVHYLGPVALYLPQTWNVWQQMATVIDPGGRKPSERKGKAWKEAVRTYMGRADLDRTREATRMFEERLFEVSGMNANELRIVVSSSLAAPLDLEVEEFGDEPRVLVGVASATPGVQGEVGGWGICDGGLTVFDRVALDQFFDQIRLLYPLLEKPNEAPAKPGPKEGKVARRTFKFLKNVYDSRDKKLPFRDLAPSRATILRESGPFSDSNLRTRAGFFSALVYRGATHNTPFLVERRRHFFLNLDDFQQAVKDCGEQDDTFFVNKNAYGVCTNRSLDHVPSYWEASGKRVYLDWLEGKVSAPSFVALFEMFLQDPELRGFGGLTSYLLASDYAIAGCVDMPSEADMAEVIVRLSAGGLGGLAKLMGRTREELKKDAKAVLQAFSSLHNVVRERIEAGILEKMGFSLFVLEHMLCKFLRLSQKVYHDIYE
ncbi:hypothetical protein CC2G_002723 [Coprinopsis cinerea AmutBmut pab1-1]|nr:hypothetical protein CC2G_002723 [Coprinopsis cinerea AmutBmut pab1-1]